MRVYKTISQIELIKGELVCPLKKGRGRQLAHQRQGSLDGACSAYSLSMALIIIGVVNVDDIVSNNLPKNTREGKFIRDLVENNGLYSEGKTFSQVKELADSSLQKIVETNLLKKKDADFITFVSENIENDIPVLLHIRWKGDDGHAVLVVGSSYDDKNKLKTFLCLDPGFESPIISAWNCIIKINQSVENEYPHNWYAISGKVQPNVYFKEALAISRK